MGISEKSQMDHIGHVESESKKWVIAGIPIRTPLKPISTNPFETERETEEEDEESSRTPTAGESRIPEPMTCPPAPRKRKPSSRCHFNGVKEFFNPPDLESVFIRVSSKSA